MGRSTPEIVRRDMRNEISLEEVHVGVGAVIVARLAEIGEIVGVVVVYVIVKNGTAGPAPFKDDTVPVVPQNVVFDLCKVHSGDANFIGSSR